MDPARRALFVRLRDKMNASCPWKTSRAVFPSSRLCAGLQLGASAQSRQQQQAFMSCSPFRPCCVSRVSLRSAALLLATNSGFVPRCRGGTCHKFAAVARQAVFKAKPALFCGAAAQKGGPRWAPLCHPRPHKATLAARGGIRRHPLLSRPPR